jgi:hypothetical protein
MPYGIPRRRFNPQSEEPVPVNWRRGMFRVWILLSASWIMAWILYLVVYGLQSGFRVTGAIPVLLLGPPVALLVFGVAAAWAFRGFRVDAPGDDAGPPTED